MIRSLVVVSILAAVAPAVRAQSYIYMDPPDVEAAVESLVTVTIQCTGLVESRGLEFWLSYDPGVVEILAYDAGEFFRDPYGNMGWLSTPGHSTGVFSLAAVMTGSHSPRGKSGDWPMIHIMFYVAHPGRSNLEFIPNAATGDPTPITVNADFEQLALGVSGHGSIHTPLLDSLTGLAQASEPGGAARPAGFNDEDGVVSFRATVPVEGGQPTRLQVEIKPRDVPFDGTGLLETMDVVISGTAEATSIPLEAGLYHWRARVKVAPDIAVSDWVEFPGDVDFKVMTASPAGNTTPSDGSSSPLPSCSGSAGSSGFSWLVVLAGLSAAGRSRRSRSTSRS